MRQGSNEAAEQATRTLNDSETQLLTEALHELKKIKAKALADVNASGLHPPGRPFQPRDFGLPQIDALLARLDGEVVAVHPTPERHVRGVDQVAIEHWDSPLYGGTAVEHNGQTFCAEIVDRRRETGGLTVTIGDDNGHIDEQLSVAFEVTNLKGSRACVAAAMLYDGEEAVFKIVRQPGGHLLLPMKPGAQVISAVDAAGQGAWRLLELNEGAR
ncbi:MAG: hypothetical protein L6Q68_08965 [Aquabacterium sp.]|nr:hypothetical protein [Aquabacterium sp.]